ncbi:MAG: hypothetical protein ACREL9_14035 [Gemmatimonadales bacterium]
MRLATRVVGLTVLCAAPAAAQTADQHWQLALGNYALSAVAQFAGKVTRGQNVGHAARSAAVQALLPTGLQHAGMTLLGQTWHLALPAQALVQKGAMLQRRSMLDQSQLDGFWTSWELDYLWLNLRVDRGRVRVPRINVETVRAALTVRHPTPTRLDWGRSLTTGVLTRLADRLSHGTWGQEAAQLVDLNRYVMSRTSSGPDDADAVYRHELQHTLQSIRSAALVDVVLRQDAAQTRPLGILRLNPGVLSPGRVQALLASDGAPAHDHSFDEWEADAYAGRTRRSFGW